MLYSYIWRIIRQGVFQPRRLKQLFGKYCSGYARILSWTNGIPSAWDGMKKVSAARKCNDKFGGSFLIVIIVTTRFLLVSFVVSE